jgi:hypothetical protein
MRNPGSRAQETLRRGLTKVSGAGTVIFAGLDIGLSIKNGEAPAHAVGRAGSTAVVGATVGGLAQAGVAALAVPGAGWAVGAGILLGTGAAILFTQTGAADWVGDRAEDAWNGMKSAGRAVGDFVGGAGRAIGDFVGGLF